MKVLQSSIFRALCSAIVGVLLIKYPADTAVWITMAIGGLFLLSGIISCIVYFSMRRHAGENVVLDADGKVIAGGMPTFPVVGVGSVILGVILLLRPGAVIDIMSYVLGAILILGAVNQMLTLVAANRVVRLSVFFWICPLLVLIVGIIALVKPMWIAGAPLVVIGWCLLLYGVTETVNALKISADRRRLDRSLRRESVSEAADPVDAEEVP